jgi:Zn-dependent protease
MQTTVGTFARTSVRAATRRVVRVAAKTSLLLFRPDAAESNEDHDSEQRPGRSGIALLIGLIALTASFAGILAMVTPQQRMDLVTPTADNAGTLAIETPTFWLMCVLASAPMGVYAAISLLTARWAGVRVEFRTGLDSVLLQAYFTGAGSFLPLTTDSELSGDSKSCGRAAGANLLTLLIVAVGLWFWGEQTGNPWIAFAAAMFLVYAFVFAFPILPLDGGYVFRESKLVWFLMWLGFLLAFLKLIPESFHVIV